jgi:hypothetical protein
MYSTEKLKLKNSRLMLRPKSGKLGIFVKKTVITNNRFIGSRIVESAA